MASAQHVPTGKRVSDRPLRPDLSGCVGPVDPPDQFLKLADYRADFHEQCLRILSWIFAFLEPRVGHDARPQLLNPSSGIGSKGESFRELHFPTSGLGIAAQYGAV